MVKKEKRNKKQESRITYNSNFFVSIFILVIMVLMFVGVAVQMGGQHSGGQTVYRDMELQYSDKYNVWFAYKNGVQIVFQDIDSYDGMLDMLGLSNQLKTKTNVSIYVDKGFDLSALVLIQKGLKATGIGYSTENTLNCNLNTLILTNNESFTGDCMKFISSNKDAYEKANGLLYHLIK